MDKKISYKNNLKAVAIFLDAFSFSVEEVEELGLNSEIRITEESGQVVGLVKIFEEVLIFKVDSNRMPIVGICKIVEESDVREIQDIENSKVPGWGGGEKYLGWINNICWFLTFSDNPTLRYAEIHVPKDEAVIGHGIIQLSKAPDITF